MAAVDAWLAEFDVGFQKLAMAQRRPKCVFQTGRSLTTLLLHVEGARQVARAVVWRTRRDIQRGDLERPFQDLKMLLRLSHDLQARGGMMVQLTSSVIERHHCCELVRMILNAPDIDARQCDRLLALLADHETKAIDALVEGTRAEYIHMRQGLHDLQHRTGSFDPRFMRDEWELSGDVNSPLACIKFITDMGGSSPQIMAKVGRLKNELLPGAWSGGKMLSDEEYAKEVEALNRFYVSILALVEQPKFRRMRDSEMESAVALLHKALRETTLAVFLEGFAPESMMRQYFLPSEAHFRGTQCLVALRRWQLQHADAPPDLKTLVKAAGMSGVPIDPFSGQPLRMAVLWGKPVIYSVGRDGKDDHGRVEEWDRNRRKWQGDLIFRLVAPPASVRKWTDNTGKHSVEAELVEVKDGSVVLRKVNGKTATVPLAKLSQSDCNHLESLKKNGGEGGE
jgi:hypothetical protein